MRRVEWNPEQRNWLENYFHTEVVSVLSPTTLDPTRPIPRILNKSLNFIVSLHGSDAFGRQRHRAIVQAPRSLPRLIQLPADLPGTGGADFVLLSSIIHAFADQLFGGLTINGCYQFRVTRNSDFYLDHEEVDDLIRALEGELFESRYGAAVRLETAHDCPDELAEYLLEHFKLGRDDLYQVNGPVNLERLLAVCDLIDARHLKYPPFTAGIPKVLIELRARFDEAANIELANRLQEAGAHVVYGVVGYKTHCKMVLVVRREAGRLRRYIHLGTGNYHPQTTRVYSDYGLLTANEQLGEDVHEVFMQITSLTKTSNLNLLFQSPFTLRDKLVELIRRETNHAAAGRKARIVAKVNALVEPHVIRALYKASMEGVTVDLVVRGICCLRPGIPEVSENIRVRSIVGRFLEHARCYYFHNDGAAEVFCSSADWMDRNLYRRIEIMYPILDGRLKRRLIRDLKINLQDNTQAWELHAGGTYRRCQPQAGDAAVSAQTVLLRELSESS